MKPTLFSLLLLFPIIGLSQNIESIELKAQRYDKQVVGQLNNFLIVSDAEAFVNFADTYLQKTDVDLQSDEYKKMLEYLHGLLSNSDRIDLDSDISKTHDFLVNAVFEAYLAKEMDSGNLMIFKEDGDNRHRIKTIIKETKNFDGDFNRERTETMKSTKVSYTSPDNQEIFSYTTTVQKDETK